MQNVVGTCSENKTMFLKKLDSVKKYCKHVLTLLQCSFATDRGDSFHLTHRTCIKWYFNCKGLLNYRSLEREKVRALNKNDYNYDENITLSDQSKNDVGGG